MRTIAYPIIVFLFLAGGCSKEIISPESGTLELGGVALRIDKENVPSGVATVEAFLTREGYDEIYGVLDILSETSAEILLEEVTVGVWHLKVNAKNEMGFVIYTGEADIEIEEGILAQVNLTLVPTGSGFGSIYIYVTWGTGSEWKDYPQNPVFTFEDSPTSPLAVTQPKVIKDAGKFKMYYNNLYNSAVVNVGYAESNDGINWFNVADDPVLVAGHSGSWDSYSVGVGAVLKINGEYKMYYTGLEDPAGIWQIGLATSADGINWNKSPEPILLSDSHEYQMHVDCVVKFKGEYLMYYSILNPYRTPYYSIGLAFSKDGISWNKSSSNPVLINSQVWENSGIYFPSVIQAENKLQMVYMNGSADGFGMAYSADGENWIKEQSNPFFKKENTSGIWANVQIAYPHILRIANEYRIYYTGWPVDYTRSNIGFLRKIGK